MTNEEKIKKWLCTACCIKDKCKQKGVTCNEYKHHIELLEWKEKAVIDKACEWLKLNCHFWYKDEDEVMDIFRKAMEE